MSSADRPCWCGRNIVWNMERDQSFWITSSEHQGTMPKRIFSFSCSMQVKKLADVSYKLGLGDNFFAAKRDSRISARYSYKFPYIISPTDRICTRCTDRNRNRNKLINQIRAPGGHMQLTIMIDTQQQYIKRLWLRYHISASSCRFGTLARYILL